MFQKIKNFLFLKKNPVLKINVYQPLDLYAFGNEFKNVIATSTSLTYDTNNKPIITMVFKCLDKK